MSEMIYAWLLHLYPQDFQKEYGGEAARLFGERYRNERGFAAKIRFWLDIAGDLTLSLIREHAHSGQEDAGVRAASDTAESPMFYIMTSQRPGSAALVAGASLSFVLLAGFVSIVGAGAAVTRTVHERWFSGGGLGLRSNAGRAALSGPVFEGVTITPARGAGEPSIAISPDGRFMAESVTVKRLIRWAFQVQDFQVQGGPSWVDSELYDVIAKAPEGASPDQTGEMMQGLLRDRLNLILGWQPKTLPVYALERENHKPTLHEVPQVVEGPSRVVSKPCGVELTFPQGATIGQLANFLSGQSWMGRPVIDRTGWSGSFELRLTWTLERPLVLVDDSLESGTPRPPLAADSSCSTSISLDTALRKQLGLRLTQTKSTIGILSVKHVERPQVN